MTEEKKLTGYPSIDKPWLKYYSEEAINAPLPECTLYDYLLENNKCHTEDIAINYYGCKITYSELFRKIDETAAAFYAMGVKAGDTVTVITLSCPSSVFCLYGLNRIGAVINYVNVLASLEELSDYIIDAGSKIVVAMDVFADKTLKAAKNAGAENLVVYSIDDGMPVTIRLGLQYKMRKQDASYKQDSMVVLWKNFINNGREAKPQYGKDPAATCYLAHTGGTTGTPKSVLLNDIAFNTVTNSYILSMPHQRGEVFLSMMIPYVVYGTLINIHMPLCLGLEVVIVPRFDVSKWAHYLRKYNVNHCCSIPAYIVPMMDDPNLQSMDLSKLKTVGTGGEGMNALLEEQLNQFLERHNSPAKILAGYGMTETCSTAAVAFAFARKTGSVGIPLSHNLIIAYDNDAHTECTYDESGEICMRCASEMLSYKDNKVETDALYRVHPDGSRWIHTGDIGHIDSDGFIFIEERMKRMIVTIIDGAGYKVFPNMIEKVLDECPDVKASCVVGMKKGNDFLLKAFVIPENKHDNASLEQKLMDLCESNLSENARPVSYSFIEHFPRTSAGKIDYRALEKRAEESE